MKPLEAGLPVGANKRMTQKTLKEYLGSEMLTGEFEKHHHISGNLEGHAYTGLCTCLEKKIENILISHQCLIKRPVESISEG